MDASTTSLLLVGFLAALGIVLYEMKASLARPVCAECSHCRALVMAREREQAELQDWYAERWHLKDQDDEPRRRR